MYVYTQVHAHTSTHSSKQNKIKNEGEKPTYFQQKIPIFLFDNFLFGDLLSSCRKI